MKSDKIRTVILLGLELCLIAMLTIATARRGMPAPKRIFAELELKDVTAIYALVGNQEVYEPYLLDLAETALLISALRQVVVYDRFLGSLSQYAGGGDTIFLIQKTDGTEIRICPVNPFFQINDAVYWTEYGPAYVVSQIDGMISTRFYEAHGFVFPDSP